MGDALIIGGCVFVSACLSVITVAWTQRVFRSRDRQVMAAGKDPDDVYLATIAHFQARQKRRRRGPYAWAVVRFLQMSRRLSARYWRARG
jgi:hypothetical protein